MIGEQAAANGEGEKHAPESSVEQKLEIADNRFFLAANIKQTPDKVYFQPTISIILTTQQEVFVR
ncbi:MULTISPECIES: hypothetical protein [Pseudomonas]|uniref:hypothetical protein n=1 Tax=Pseudomonas TaxID=286 RepID=UPI00128FA047|nr:MULTISPECIES: hypothetical protein [Pseudomonas]